MASPKKYPSGAEKRRRRKAKQHAAPPSTLPAPPSGEEQAEGAADFLAQYRAGEDAPSVYDEAIGFLRAAMRQSVTAAGQAGAALERTARIAASLVKAVDPKRQIEELGADLRAAAKDIAELEERVSGASRQPSRGPAEPPGPPIN